VATAFISSLRYLGSSGILLTTSPLLAFAGLFAKALFKTPYAVFMGQPYTEYAALRSPMRALLAPLYEAAMRITLRSADAVITHSRYLEEYAMKRGATHVHRIPYYGVDCKQFKPMKAKRPKQFTILMVARFAPEKGHAYLIEALRMLEERGVSLAAVFVGVGQLRKQMENLAKGYELDVLFLPFISEHALVHEMNKAHLVVQPSVSEGFGFTAAEALACARPVVASSAGGLPDAIGGYGVLVPPKNPKALANAIELVMRDYKRYERLAQKGRKYAIKNIEKETVTRRFVAVLDSIVREHR
jgi:glycosyltransferase involved in cell wall biosynthesis